jgi:hypothetical protein
MGERPTGTVWKKRTNTRNTDPRAVPFVPACEIIAALREGRDIESLFIHHHIPEERSVIPIDRNNNPGTNVATTSIFNDPIQSDFNGNSSRPTNLVTKRSDARLNTTRLEEKEESRKVNYNNTLLANKSITEEKNGNTIVNINNQSALKCDNTPTTDDGKSCVLVELDDSSSNKSLDVKKSSSSSSSRKPSERSEKSSRRSKNPDGKKKRTKTAQSDIAKMVKREAADGAPCEDREEEQDAETMELAKLRCTSERTEVIAEREHRRQKRCADYPGHLYTNLSTSLAMSQLTKFIFTQVLHLGVLFLAQTL